MDLGSLNVGRNCCDPFQRNKKKITKGLHFVTEELMERNPACNLTAQHKVCPTCRNLLLKSSSSDTEPSQMLSPSQCDIEFEKEYELQTSIHLWSV